MSAGKLNLQIEQRSTFSKRLVWKDKNKRPINLTGYTAHLQVRQTASDPVVLLNLTTENGGIVITPLAGAIEIKLSSVGTINLSFSAAVYDMKLFAPDGTEKRLIEGRVVVSPGVTQ